LPTLLADRSALGRLQTSTEVRDVLDPLLLRGEVAVCGIVELEMLYSASSRRNYRAAAEALRGMPHVPLDERCVERALEVQALLAERSQHRAVALPDLLVAACAERAGVIVIHYDADFDRIAKLTGQGVRWVVPRGSVD
jgi:predicted nucleic acid-binding protein